MADGLDLEEMKVFGAGQLAMFKIGVLINDTLTGLLGQAEGELSSQLYFFSYLVLDTPSGQQCVLLPTP